MTKIKSPPLLLADDIAMETTQEKRSNGVKLHATALAKKVGTSIELVHVENLLLGASVPVVTVHSKKP